MVSGRIPGPIGSNRVNIEDGTNIRAESPTQGPLRHNEPTSGDGSSYEQVKIEVAADLAQLVLDITGILDPTPLSDGTNALISLARGRWTDAVISAVSIVPYFGDLSKLGKLPGYLESIRKAVRLARTDKVWGQRLRETFRSLKRLLDRVFDVAGDQIPDSARKTLQKMLDEINDFLMPGSVARRSAGGSSAKAKSQAKGGGDGGGKKRPTSNRSKKKEAVSSTRDDGNVGSAKDADRPYSNPKNRPPYGKDQVDEVWNEAKQPDGNVYDPNTGEKLEWDKKKSRAGQWDMGHKPGKEYRKLHKDYMDGKITKEEFLKEYRDPNNYSPEAPSSNRSGRFEGG